MSKQALATILFILLGALVTSCRGSGRSEDLIGGERVNYFISRYYTTAGLQAQPNDDGTLWDIRIQWEKRISLENSPEAYRKLAREHGEDGTKEFITIRTYEVPCDFKKISIWSGEDDVSEDFDILFPSVYEVIRDGKGYVSTLKSRLSEVSDKDLMWLADCRFFISKRKPIEYTDLRLIVNLTSGKKIECKLTDRP